VGSTPVDCRSRASLPGEKEVHLGLTIVTYEV
jgi:hypothetical protein